MASVALTPGRLTALWLILRTVDKLGGEAESTEVQRYAARSSLRSGALPIGDGVQLAREGAFLREHGSRVTLAPLAERALKLADEDEPPQEARRLFLSVLLLRDPPPWVAYWQGSPGSLDLVVPERERRSLEEGALFPPAGSDDLVTWAFWRALGRVPLMEETADQRKAIGNAGEELTVAHERARLTSEGFPHLAGEVRWLARESDAYGFDVLSYAGASASRPETAIAIEVKSSALPASAYVRFFLSAHEWETACELGDRYRIHIWTRVDPGPPPRARDGGPQLVRPVDLARHLPGAPGCPDPCRWQSAEIHLPVATIVSATHAPA